PYTTLFRSTGVRAERLHEITEADAISEGVAANPYVMCDGTVDELMSISARDNFRALWDKINGKRPGCSWGDNPWVWAASFRRVWLAPWLAPTEPNSTGIPRCGRGEDDAR